MTKSLGLIAGNGVLPHLIAKEAKKSGYRVAACLIKGEADPGLASLVDSSETIKLGQLGALVKFFQRENVTETAMGGKITKTNLFKGEVQPDFDMIKVVAGARNHSDDSLLGAIAGHLDSKNLPLRKTVELLGDDALPGKGVLTKRKPSDKEKKDIEYGWQLAKEMGRLDVGQTVVVKNLAVLAVEAIEGTDEAIIRGGSLGREESVVVKVAKPNQDLRFDVPTVGCSTIEAMKKAGAKVLAIEAGATIVLEREKFIQEANDNQIVVICI